MRGRDLVDWDGALIPRALVEDVQVKGACPSCGGLGLIPEQIDSDRWPTVVPCDRCRRYCATCRKWVEKKDHTHGGATSKEDL